MMINSLIIIIHDTESPGDTDNTTQCTRLTQLQGVGDSVIRARQVEYGASNFGALGLCFGQIKNLVKIWPTQKVQFHMRCNFLISSRVFQFPCLP